MCSSIGRVLKIVGEIKSNFRYILYNIKNKDIFMKCINCGIEKDVLWGKGNKYCSKKCQISYTNKDRVGKIKIINCISCEAEFEVSKSHKNKDFCPECKKENNLKKKLELAIPGICENCGIEHEGTYGSGRFCSLSCSNSRERPIEVREKISKKLIGIKHSDEWNEKSKHISNFEVDKKISDTLKKYYADRPELKKAISEFQLQRGPCKESTREKLKNAQLKLIADGKHKGWSTRLGKASSYPERFFMDVLKNNNILYQRELKVDKYFIDFAIENKRIALEIDGSQHLEIERKESDIKKDLILKEANWKVYRIPWNQINNDIGKEIMKEKIDNFIEFYNSL